MNVLEFEQPPLFAETENQEMIAQTVRDFAKKYITPFRNKWDDSPLKFLKNWGDLDLWEC